MGIINSINIAEIGISLLSYWRLYVICIHIRGNQFGCRQPGKIRNGLWRLVGEFYDLLRCTPVFEQHGEFGRPGRLFAFDDVHITDCHDEHVSV